MPCFHPLDAYQSRSLNSEGKREILFNKFKATDHEAIQLPCGQCVGCRLERSRQWAIRCMHEASMHEHNCFITLTFNNDALYKRENPLSVDVRDFQLFMKRLRNRFGKNIRYYHCGEYGDLNERPHYHACIFNFDFPDKKLWKITPAGSRLYISDILSDIWSDPDTGETLGFSTIGDVTFESAAYVARYVMKKINGKQLQEIDHQGLYPYERIIETGETITVHPEYTTMSRRPGIGKGWLDKYMDDVYPHDYVIVNGKKCKPPKYYDGVLKTTRPYEFDEVKENRLTQAEKHADNNTPDRLAVREKVTNARLKQLPRNI